MNQNITNIKQSFWVSANAGSGKTKIIIDRIVALLLSGVSVKKILAITFTKAASREMLHRVESKLQELLAMDKEEFQGFVEYFLNVEIRSIDIYWQNLQKAEQEKESLRIQTIHSFAQNILQEFSLEAGLRPNFQIMDEITRTYLLEEVKDKLFTEDSISEIINRVSKDFHYITISNVLNEIVANRTKINYILQNYDNFADFLQGLEKYIKPSNDSKKKLLSEFFTKIDRGFLQNLVNSIEENEKKSDLKRVPFLENLAKKQNLENFRAAFCKKDDDFKWFTKNVNLDVAEGLEEICEEYQILNDALKRKKLYENSEDFILLAQIFLKYFEKLKKEKNLIDYEDIILFTINLLKNPEYRDLILYKLDNQIDHLLLDEAQDTSPWQWEIVDLLLEEQFSQIQEKVKSFFIVGDDKQSIYSFQGADHFLFSKMKNKYAKALDAIGKKLSVIKLQKSYRTTSPILELVDKIANEEKVVTALNSDIEDKKIEHISARKLEASKVTIYLEKEEEIEQEEHIAWSFPSKIIKKNSIAIEKAGFVADKIAELLKSKAILPSTGEHICPQDIMVLSKKRGEAYKQLIKKLAEKKIALNHNNKFDLLNHIIAMDLVAILKFCYVPEDDLNLACMLKSPLFSLNEQDIYQICSKRAEQSIFVYLQEKEEYKKICSLLEDIKKKENIFSLGEFYLYILESLGFKNKYFELYGNITSSICYRFLGLIENFEKLQKTNYEFLEYLHSYPIIVEEQLEENINKVNLLTAHSSKGLQAPIVFLLTDSGKEPRDGLLIDNEKKLIFYNGGEFPSDVLVDLDILQEKKIGESIRLLYVAMTRASDFLYIVPCNKKAKSGEGNIWQKYIVQASVALGYVEKDGFLVNEQLAEIKFAEEKFVNENNNHLLKTIKFSENKKQKNKIASHSDKLEGQNLNILLGSICHQIFYFIGQNIECENLEERIEKFAQKFLRNINEKSLEKILANITEILKDAELVKLLWQEKGYFELSLAIKEQGKILTGQIDRLIEREGGEFVIIDYKYEKYSIEAVDKYKKQLEVYQRLVQANFSEVSQVSKKLFFVLGKIVVDVG